MESVKLLIVSFDAGKIRVFYIQLNKKNSVKLIFQTEDEVAGYASLCLKNLITNKYTN
jgi:hypothetical protein